VVGSDPAVVLPANAPEGWLRLETAVHEEPQTTLALAGREVSSQEGEGVVVTRDASMPEIQ
jgi:hypothetical protein